MPSSTVAALSAASALAGTELFYADQSGDVKVTGTQIKTLAVGAGSVAVTTAKTLTVTHSLTFAGTDSTTLTFPATTATIARTDAGQTFTGTQAFGAVTATTVNSTPVAVNSAVSGVTASSPFVAQADTNSNPIMGLVAYGGHALGAVISIFKTRHATGANTIVAADDVIGGISFRGSNGTTYNVAGSLRFMVDGTPGATNDMPGRFEIKTTPDGSGTEATRVIVNRNGLVVLGATQANTVPALKPSSTVLQTRLGDDSDFAPLQGQIRVHANAATETITPDKTLRFYDAAGVEYKVACVAV